MSMIDKKKFYNFCKEQGLPFITTDEAVQYSKSITNSQLQKFSIIRERLLNEINKTINSKLSFLKTNKLSYLTTAKQLVTECIDAFYNPEKYFKYQ